MQTDLPSHDPLDDFDPRPVELLGVTRTVHVSGTGPAIIVMAEMPGITPYVARFARWVRDAGFTVYLPSLFGQDEASPVTQWLRALARAAHQACGGPGVGAIGMCFTGNFALSMMLEPAMLAPVLCQPSLPLENPGATGIPARDLAVVRRRLEQEDLTVLAYRFEGDKWCQAQRFAAFGQALGPRFVARVLPDSAANPQPAAFYKHVVASPHSVVTAHLIDQAGQPTLAARDEILAFFGRRLQ
jgi:dienelactone hydrolase